MRTKIILFITAVSLILCTSCLKDIFCIEGDRNLTTEVRRTLSFNQAENSTSFDVIYKEADTFGIRISAEQNILDYIETTVNENCLEIRTYPSTVCLDFHEHPVIMISSPELNRVINSGSGSFIVDSMTGEKVSIKNSGSGDISVEMVESNDFESVLSGSGDIDVFTIQCLNSDILISGSGTTSLSGNCENSHYKITGSGNILGSQFSAITASVIISGSGSAYTDVSDHLTALISGSGNIYLKGDPEVEQTISGSGRIIKTK